MNMFDYIDGIPRDLNIQYRSASIAAAIINTTLGIAGIILAIVSLVFTITFRKRKYAMK